MTARPSTAVFPDQALHLPPRTHHTRNRSDPTPVSSTYRARQATVNAALAQELVAAQKEAGELARMTLGRLDEELCVLERDLTTDIMRHVGKGPDDDEETLVKDTALATTSDASGSGGSSPASTSMASGSPTPGHVSSAGQSTQSPLATEPAQRRPFSPFCDKCDRRPRSSSAPPTLPTADLRVQQPSTALPPASHRIAQRPSDAKRAEQLVLAMQTYDADWAEQERVWDQAGGAVRHPGCGMWGQIRFV